tara:strand:+ start:93 stop:632 length:540 start_codon:yes stop_codon:yes gene_type:complete
MPFLPQAQTVPGFYIFDMSEFLSEMDKPWSIGNGIDIYTGEFVGPYFEVEVHGGMNMNGHRLEIMNATITVYGDSINSGEVTKRFESSNLYFAPLLNVEPRLEKLQINLFPNPSVEYVTIEGVYMQRITVYDMNGKIVNRAKPRSNKFKMNVSSLSSGIYIMQIWCNNGRGVFKKLIIK